MTATWTLWRLRGLTARSVELTQAWSRLLESGDRRALDGPAFEGRGEQLQVLAVRTWMECSRTLGAICAARGIDYLHVLQPTLHDEGAKVPTAEELEQGAIADSWLEGVRVGYPLLRAGGERLEREGWPFVDLSRLFEDVEQTLYVDKCHFGQAGNDLLAEALAAELLERVTWPR